RMPRMLPTQEAQPRPSGCGLSATLSLTAPRPAGAASRRSSPGISSVSGDQRAVLLQHLRRIGKPLGLGFGDPPLLERGCLRLHFIDEGLACLGDLDAIGLHGGIAAAV